MQSLERHYIITFRDQEHPTSDRRVTIRVREIGESYLGPSFVKISNIIFQNNQMILDHSDKLIRSRFKDTEALHILAADIIKVEEVGGYRFRKKTG